MKCPKCDAPDTGVSDSRSASDDAAIRRRRRCIECGYRFTTYELEASDLPGFSLQVDGSVNPNTRRIAAELADTYTALGMADAALLIGLARRLRIECAGTLTPLRGAEGARAPS